MSNEPSELSKLSSKCAFCQAEIIMTFANGFVSDVAHADPQCATFCENTPIGFAALHSQELKRWIERTQVEIAELNVANEQARVKIAELEAKAAADEGRAREANAQIAALKAESASLRAETVRIEAETARINADTEARMKKGHELAARRGKLS